MKIETLRDFYIEGLRDLYSAENQILESLPRMSNSATSPALLKAFDNHIDETRVHVTRLDDIFQALNASPNGRHCKAMEGILSEAEEVYLSDMPDTVRDAALISVAQRVEHYEMAGYGCVRTYARLFGDKDAVASLAETLQDEGDADKRLSEIAESTVNDDAAEEAISS